MTNRRPRSTWMIIAIVVVIFLLFLSGRLFAGRNSPAGGGAVNPPVSPSLTISQLLATLTPFRLMTPTPLPPDYPTRVAETLTARPTTPPTPTSTLAPPACTFPLGHTTTAESKPEEYTFSEPEVVLTAAKGNIYHIAQWLPDNLQVLMTEEIRNVGINNSKPLQESIDLYDPTARESKTYATGADTSGIPFWVPRLNAVVYPLINYTVFDKEKHNFAFTRQVWVSYGDPATARMLAQGLPQAPFGMKPDGSEIVYLSEEELLRMDGSLNPLPSVPIDPTRWDYARTPGNSQPNSYEMAWQPGTSMIFLYTEGFLGGAGYTFVLDADTGRICELNLGGWAEAAHWSVDGRYLAIIRAKEYSFPLHESALAVLDTATGNVTVPQGLEQVFMTDLAWAPDGRHLVAMGGFISAQTIQNGMLVQELRLIDVVSGQSAPAVPGYRGLVYSNDNNFVWSPDGSKLVLHCPTQTQDQMCLIRAQGAEQ